MALGSSEQKTRPVIREGGLKRLVRRAQKLLIQDDPSQAAEIESAREIIKKMPEPDRSQNGKYSTY